MRSHKSPLLLAVLLSLPCAASADPKPAAISARLEAMTLAKQNRSQEAIAGLKRALEIDANYPEAWADLGNLHLASGNLGEATKAFESALRIRPGFQIARYNLAYALRKSGAYERAAQQYQLYLQRTPDDPDAQYGLAESLRSAGKDAAAAEAYEHYAVVERRPEQKKWVEKAKKRARELRAKLNPNTVKSKVAKKKKKAPEPPDAKGHLSFSERGATPEAIAKAEGTTQPDAKPTADGRPDSFREGLNKLQRGEYEGALLRLNVAARSTPKDAITLAAIGSANLGLRRGKAAEKAYRKSLATASSDALPGIYLGLGEALRLQGMNKAAIDAYQQAGKHESATNSIKRVVKERIALLK